MLRLKEVLLYAAEPFEISVPSIDLNDHYSGESIRHHVPLSGSLMRVISYRTGADGIEKSSITDITKECSVISASKDAVNVKIPAAGSMKNRNGQWEGVLPSENGAIPEQLLKITKRWARLRVPAPAEIKWFSLFPAQPGMPPSFVRWQPLESCFHRG